MRLRFSIILFNLPRCWMCTLELLFEVSFLIDIGKLKVINQDYGFWCMRAYVMAVDEFNECLLIEMLAYN